MGAVFVAVLADELRAQADAEKRRAVPAHGAVQRIGHAAFTQVGHRVAERPDAR